MTSLIKKFGSWKSFNSSIDKSVSKTLKETSYGVLKALLGKFIIESGTGKNDIQMYVLYYRVVRIFNHLNGTSEGKKDLELKKHWKSAANAMDRLETLKISVKKMFDNFEEEEVARLKRELDTYSQNTPGEKSNNSNIADDDDDLARRLANLLPSAPGTNDDKTSETPHNINIPESISSSDLPSESLSTTQTDIPSGIDLDELLAMSKSNTVTKDSTNLLLPDLEDAILTPLVSSHPSNTNTLSASTQKFISVEEFEKKLDEFLVVDLRPPASFKMAALQPLFTNVKQVNVPEDTLFQGMTRDDVRRVIRNDASLFDNEDGLQIVILTHDLSSSKLPGPLPEGPLKWFLDAIELYGKENLLCAQPLILDGGFREYYAKFPVNCSAEPIELQVMHGTTGSSLDNFSIPTLLQASRKPPTRVPPKVEPRVEPSAPPLPQPMTKNTSSLRSNSTATPSYVQQFQQNKKGIVANSTTILMNNNNLANATADNNYSDANTLYSPPPPLQDGPMPSTSPPSYENAKEYSQQPQKQQLQQVELELQEENQRQRQVNDELVHLKKKEASVSAEQMKLQHEREEMEQMQKKLEEKEKELEEKERLQEEETKKRAVSIIQQEQNIKKQTKEQQRLQQKQQEKLKQQEEELKQAKEMLVQQQKIISSQKQVFTKREQDLSTQKAKLLADAETQQQLHNQLRQKQQLLQEQEKRLRIENDKVIYPTSSSATPKQPPHRVAPPSKPPPQVPQVRKQQNLSPSRVSSIDYDSGKSRLRRSKSITSLADLGVHKGNASSIYLNDLKAKQGGISKIGTSKKTPTSETSRQAPSSATVFSPQVPQVNRAEKPSSALTGRCTPQLNVVRRHSMNLVYSASKQSTGLKNLGNTCFMNTVIQCFAHNPTLIKYFVERRYRNDLNRNNFLGCKGEVAEEFAEVVSMLSQRSCKYLSPTMFRAVFGNHRSQFSSYEQQDCQEFANVLLDCLHEDLNRVIEKPKHTELCFEGLDDFEASELAWKDHISRDNSFISKLFQGQYRSVTRCLKCNYESVNFSVFTFLTLPIPPGLHSSTTIEACLKQFKVQELMSGDNKWKCASCNGYQDAVKEIGIWKLPPCLIIHLKRFSFAGPFKDKINTTVAFPTENFEFHKNVMNPMERKNRPYSLYGVANHYGSLSGGHYIAYAKTGQIWEKYDDSAVRRIPEREVCTNAAYLLFYTRLN
eukprot:m.121457 g.121457  ORF g.121457 m.121457 type:complete len:1200 (+) comp9378_c0_seq2:226-3825(+)